LRVLFLQVFNDNGTKKQLTAEREREREINTFGSETFWSNENDKWE
jgi:hypothetical protein